MRQRMGIWLVVVVVMLVVTGLVGPALAQKAVKIGVLTPLSPPGDASAGQFIVRGAKTGAEDVNARGGVLGGRKIEPVVEDDAGTPEKGVAGFRKWQQWSPPILFTQYTRPEQPFADVKIIFPPELKTGDLVLAPKH